MPADRDQLERVAHALFSSGEITHLGTGGFASTFRVELSADDGTSDVFALKIIDPGVADSARVAREFGALRRVDHERVVAYRSLGTIDVDEVTYSWLAMDFIPGTSLTHALNGGRTFTVTESLRLIRDAVAGACAIWAAGTAHRDLSPNNLLVTDEGRIVIVDLGLARHIDDETITVLPTPGTPGWMAPEQVGPDPTHGDWRSDQFVLGLVAYLLLTGVPPFGGRNLQERWAAPAISSIRPLREINPDLPLALSDIVERMTARYPHRRYLQPTALLDELERAYIAVGNSSATPDASPAYWPIVGQIKNFFTAEFLAKLAADGLVVDARARARCDELCRLANSGGSAAIIDPFTYLSRSPNEFRPAFYTQLPYGSHEGALIGFTDEGSRREWVESVVRSELDAAPDIVLAPYFYAASGEYGWITETLQCAVTARDVLEQIATESGTEVSPMWTALGISASWLSVDNDRERLLTALTGQTMESLYLQVHTSQVSFGPLADKLVLDGFVDLINVMREAGVPVIAGRRASSGLLLVALGAAGWSTGVHANLQNMTPHPEVEPQGGPADDRIYIPQLLNSIATTTLAIFAEARPDLRNLDTDYGRELIQENPTLEVLSTPQRMLLNQHNLMAQRSQVSDLAVRGAAARRALMAEWVERARELYSDLPTPRVSAEGGRFLDVWASAL